MTERKVVIPGEVIFSGEDYLPGNGTAKKGDDIVALKFGLAGGIVTAIYIALMTLIAIIRPDYAITSIDLLVEIYGFIGYDVNWLGILLGAIYGFVDGFIFTWIFALIYNKLLKSS